MPTSRRLACYQGEEFETAAKSFRYVHERFGDRAMRRRPVTLKGLTYWKNTQFGAARNAFETVVRAYPQSESAPLALIAAAMLALEQDYLTTSRRSLQTLVVSYPEHPVASKTSQAMKLLDQYETLPRNRKSWPVSCRRWCPQWLLLRRALWRRITAFIINAWPCRHRYRNPPGKLCCRGDRRGRLPFYFGNIYGSAMPQRNGTWPSERSCRNQLELVLSCDFW